MTFGFHRWLIVCFFCIGLFPRLVFAEEPQKKVALIIGNSAYTHVGTLANPLNDAKDISASLTRIGFEVTTGIDLDYRAMRLALRDFANVAAAADMVLIYYAGHGIEVDKTNFLIPVDAALASDAEVEFEAISLNTVLRAVAASDGVKILLLDACRNNPFRVKMKRTIATRSVGRGLARVDPGGVLVGYAAREGTEALDGEGRNSPYAKALLEHLEQPGLEIGKLFRNVRDSVHKATSGKQEPFTYGALPGRDIFLAGAAVSDAKPLSPVAPEAAVSQTLLDDYSRAVRLDTNYYWNLFLKRHGGDSDNALTEIAKQRLVELKDEVERRKAERQRAPWLVPAAGLNGNIDQNLNLPERQLVQRSLGYMGFDTGGVDGQFGPKTRSAIYAARVKLGLPAGDYVYKALLQQLPDPRVIEGLLSDKARTYQPSDLPPGLEPRLAKALTVYKGQKVLFDYYEGRLYLAVLGIGYGGWTSANQMAQKAGGHLATINNARENAFLFKLFSKDRRFLQRDGGGWWHGPSFGLYQRKGSKEPRGGWSWVTAEPVTYTNWTRGNPDNFDGNQNLASFFSNKEQDPNGRNVSKWDDVPSVWIGYLVEIE